MLADFFTRTISTLVSGVHVVLRGDSIYNENSSESDKKNALLHYKSAAERGNIRAFEKLIQFYETEGNDALVFYYRAGRHLLLKEWLFAIDNYEKAAQANVSDALFQLALLYQSDRRAADGKVLIKKNISLMINYLSKVAPSLPKALNSLLSLSESEGQANFALGEMIEIHGKKENNVLHPAFYYYKKANDQADTRASLKLGQWYENGIDATNKALTADGISPNSLLAFEYYLRAAPGKTIKALEGLERITQQLDKEALWIKLGEAYHTYYQAPFQSMRCFKMLAARGSELGNLKLSELAQQNAECAYLIAKDYEKEHQLSKAYGYYIMAMHQGHVPSLEYMTKLAEDGEDEAKFCLSYDYYYVKKDYENAIYWGIHAAESSHPSAALKLKETTFSPEYYIKIARHYELGDLGKKNEELSLYFSEKAYALKYGPAAFRLGDLYLSKGEHTFDLALYVKAYNYFKEAAEWGHLDALDTLARLRNELLPPFSINSMQNSDMLFSSTHSTKPIGASSISNMNKKNVQNSELNLNTVNIKSNQSFLFSVKPTVALTDRNQPNPSIQR